MMPNEVTSLHSPYILLTRGESVPSNVKKKVKQKNILKNVKTILAKRIVKFLQIKENAD